VITSDGAKLTDPARITAVRAKIAEVLDGDPAASSGRLPRARASQAR
jgi:hypothetical protein